MITSKHYFSLIPIFCQIATDFYEWSSKSKANWPKQSPPNTISQSFAYCVKIRIMFIIIWSPPNTISQSFLFSSKLQLTLMNGHQNQKQIGHNNHLQTLFQTHSHILANYSWFWIIVIKIRSQLVMIITSKHYFSLIPIFCPIATYVVK